MNKIIGVLKEKQRAIIQISNIKYKSINRRQILMSEYERTQMLFRVIKAYDKKMIDISERNDENMKIRLKEKIKELLEAHKVNNDNYNISREKIIEEWNSTEIKERYTLLGIREVVNEQLKEVEKNLIETDEILNRQLKSVVENTKREFLPELYDNADKSLDYSIKINNAIQFINAMGNELTDESAYEILKEFAEDYSTMKQFKNIMEKQSIKIIDEFTGKNEFQKTFGKFNKIQTKINIFNDFESYTNSLFIYPKNVADSDGYNLLQDSYSELKCELEILDAVAMIENYKDTNASTILEA